MCNTYNNKYINNIYIYIYIHIYLYLSLSLSLSLYIYIYIYHGELQLACTRPPVFYYKCYTVDFNNFTYMY